MPVPVIAALNGPAAGGGLGLALATDYCLAAESASFTAAYFRLGLTPDGGASTFLERSIGLMRTRELLLTNRRLGAREAYDWGLVNAVVADEELLDQAVAFAENLDPCRATPAADPPPPERGQPAQPTADGVGRHPHRGQKRVFSPGAGALSARSALEAQRGPGEQRLERHARARRKPRAPPCSRSTTTSAPSTSAPASRSASTARQRRAARRHHVLDQHHPLARPQQRLRSASTCRTPSVFRRARSPSAARLERQRRHQRHRAEHRPSQSLDARGQPRGELDRRCAAAGRAGS